MAMLDTLIHRWLAHFLSRCLGYIANCTWPIIKYPLIRGFIRWKNVDMTEATQESPSAYKCFNDFFIRSLKPDARPLPVGDHVLACPADGVLSQFGAIAEDRLIQAKGHEYRLLDLLAGDKVLAEQFQNGQFATIYLSPRDYHRLHMPLGGTLKEMIHVSGDLFSVKPERIRDTPNLYARNERVIAVFDTEAGPMALILVGAIVVASTATVWHGTVTPSNTKTIQRWRYAGDPAIKLARGEEMGYFNIGSTIIVLFGKDRITWELTEDMLLKMGQSIGYSK